MKLALSVVTMDNSALPTWMVVLICIGIFLDILWGARLEERRRQRENQPHTRKDSALLLLSGLTVCAVLLLLTFYQPLFINSRIGIAVVIVVVGGGLTYLFNRKRIQHP
jgi:hypothetical protein